jgi:hypothetical protein
MLGCFDEEDDAIGVPILNIDAFWRLGLITPLSLNLKVSSSPWIRTWGYNPTGVVNEDGTSALSFEVKKDHSGVLGDDT